MPREIKYTNFKELPLHIFIEYMKELDNTENPSNLDESIILLKWVTNMTEEEIINLPTRDFTFILNQLNFKTIKYDFNPNEPIIINGNTWYLETKNMTVSQWMDIENFEKKYKTWDRIIPILSLILKLSPDEKYDGGIRYSRVNLIRDFPTEIGWVISGFFLSGVRNLEQLSQKYGALMNLIQEAEGLTPP